MRDSPAGPQPRPGSGGAQRPRPPSPIAWRLLQNRSEIAALSRTVSANVWQKRPELGAKHGIDWWLGRPSDRNVVLKINKR